MALKTLMIRAKLDSAQRELDALQEQDEIFAAREAELTNDIGEAKTKEERETVEAAVEKFDSEHAAHEAAKNSTVIIAGIVAAAEQITDYPFVRLLRSLFGSIARPRRRRRCVTRSLIARPSRTWSVLAS